MKCVAEIGSGGHTLAAPSFKETGSGIQKLNVRVGRLGSQAHRQHRDCIILR